MSIRRQQVSHAKDLDHVLRPAQLLPVAFSKPVQALAKYGIRKLIR